MKLRRRVPLFYPTGEFRCRVNREDVPELLANREADPRCDRCGSPTAESSCFDGKDHDLILILRRASFNREGPPSSFTHAETEAYAGVHGYIPKAAARTKFAGIAQNAAFVSGGQQMKFPNLVWAIGQHRLAHYQIAATVGMSESRFSRCLSARAEFSAEERRKLIAILGYPAGWLFQEIVPPEMCDVRKTGARHRMLLKDRR